jgi:hypothetical protein
VVSSAKIRVEAMTCRRKRRHSGSSHQQARPTQSPIYGPRPLCKKNSDTIARRFAAIYPGSGVELLPRAMMGIRARPV